MYCALDKIDLAATVDGRTVAVQTDHRSASEIERDLAQSILFAMTRAVNARSEAAQVHYVVVEPPRRFAEALHAVGAVISETATRLVARDAPAPDDERAGELADDCFRELAQRVAARVGTRDPAMALRMLEDETFAAPPQRDDPRAYWRRVIELAALTGELLRAKFGASHTTRGFARETVSRATGARWVLTDRALVPFGFTLPVATGGSTTIFPTNRAQRVIEDGRDESLFKLLIAAEETLLRPDSGRLMPSLRERSTVELDEVVWRSLLPDAPRLELPIVVCGLDGESTFGMIRREALQRTPDEAMAEALENLGREEIEIGELIDNEYELSVLALCGSFYAAEKLLDQALMQELHDHLETSVLLAATPSRGGLFVTAGDEPGTSPRFAAFVRKRYDLAGNRALSPVVWIVEHGRITGFVRSTAPARADTSQIRAETSPDHPADQQTPGVLRRRK